MGVGSFGSKLLCPSLHVYKVEHCLQPRKIWRWLLWCSPLSCVLLPAVKETNKTMPSVFPLQGFSPPNSTVVISTNFLLLFFCNTFLEQFL